MTLDSYSLKMMLFLSMDTFVNYNYQVIFIL